ncbi:MAG: hypothetical protein IKN57_14850 [Parasporobacterium sp.]|nr:hypothetical protein [Parasporobacterium sp.]MBR3644770.1 hypothetical protein [Parasporobacterium sp.]
MFLKSKPEKTVKKKGFANKKKVPEYFLPPDKKGKSGKGSRPYSLEEMMFYDDVIYDEW